MPQAILDEPPHNIDDAISSLMEKIKTIDINNATHEENDKVIIIQKWCRGYLHRLKELPLVLKYIQFHLSKEKVILSAYSKDGRLNSCTDEDKIIEILTAQFMHKIFVPKIRMWYDILALDHFYGWIPVNIKTTTTLTSDNTGNLAMCVHSYTNEILDVHRNKTYQNGLMGKILVDKLKNHHYNKSNKKDYYFIVINKTNTEDVIINSIKGLTTMTPNINNLPFQVCWNKNRVFKYGMIDEKIKLFTDCLKKPKPSWKEVFLSEIRKF